MACEADVLCTLEEVIPAEVEDPTFEDVVLDGVTALPWEEED